MEGEKVNEAEDTTLRIIWGQLCAQNETEEELTVQKRFVSAIRCLEQCTMDLLNYAVTKLRKV